MAEEKEPVQLDIIEECKAALAKARGKEKGPIYLKMGDAYKALKQNSKALVCYREAHDAGLLEPEFIERFAGDLADSGKGEDALDMLQKAIAGTKDQLLLARLYTRAATVSRLIERYEPGLKMAKKALEAAGRLEGESPEVRRVQAEANAAIGLILWRIGDFAKAQLAFEKALEIYKVLDDRKGLADVYNHIGIMYSIGGEPAKAMDFFDRSQQILDKARIYINRGIVKVHAGDFKGAEEDLRTAIKKGHEEGYKFSVHLAQMDLAELFMDMDNIAKARTWIDLAYKGFMEMDQDPRVAMALETMARVQLREGDVKGARLNVDRATAIAVANKAKEIEAWCHYVNGLVLLEEGDPETARHELVACIDILKKVNHVRLMGRVYMALAKVDRMLGCDSDAKAAAAEARKVLERIGSKYLIKKMDDDGL